MVCIVPSNRRREICAFVTGSRRTRPASTLGASVAGRGTVTRFRTTTGRPRLPIPRSPNVGTPTRGPMSFSTRRVRAPGGSPVQPGTPGDGAQGVCRCKGSAGCGQFRRTRLQGRPHVFYMTQARLRLGCVSCRVLPRSAISRFVNPLVFGGHGQLITQSRWFKSSPRNHERRGVSGRKRR